MAGVTGHRGAAAQQEMKLIAQANAEKLVAQANAGPVNRAETGWVGGLTKGRESKPGRGGSAGV